MGIGTCYCNFIDRQLSLRWHDCSVEPRISAGIKIAGRLLQQGQPNFAAGQPWRKEDSLAQHSGLNLAQSGEPNGAAALTWESRDAALDRRGRDFGSSLHDAEMAFSNTLSEKREEVKADRTAAKRAVTMAAKRLTTGINRRMMTVPEMARELDEKYCRFF